MSLYTQLVSSVLFPLHERLKRHDSVAVRRHMEEAQWWDATRLADYRVERLRALLLEAETNVPYYRQLFALRGIDPHKVECVDDLARLPLLTKPIISANVEALKSERGAHLARFNTGGSSGQPLIFFVGRERISHDVAAKWRATRWWGVDIGDRELVVWGSPIELGAQDRLRCVRDWLLRTELLPAFEMSPEKLDRFVDAIARARPAMLFGYPSALSHIACHAERRGTRLDDKGIRVAFVTSERLYDNQRATIGRVFGCRVANGYGGRDAGFIAHECPDGGMHITADDIIVELIGPDDQPVADGEPGEVVITHLATADFPFIRYRTGDVAVRDTASCRCGRGLPLLKEIQGRTTDFVVAADGTVMHGLALIYVVRDVPGVESFRIVQESRQHTTVQLVVDERFKGENVARIAAGLRQRLGASVHVAVDVVPAIPVDQAGKFRYVVSRVQATV